MKPYDVSSLPYMIIIGYCGENHWRPIPTDCAALLKDHPNGIVTLWVQPDGESEAFPVELNHGDGDVYIWTPLAEEMTAATGKMQYMCTDGTDIGKSSVVKFYANGSIIPGAEHPADMPSWAAEMIRRSEAAAQRAEQAAESIDIDPETVAQAVAAYLEEHPVEGEPGASAYELAVEQGYTGTLAEWLDSLKGADGADGQAGQQGPVGAPGSDYVLTAQDKADIAALVLAELPAAEEVLY